MLWALGPEDQAFAGGRNAELVDKYDPNNSGFGKKYKLTRGPERVLILGGKKKEFRAGRKEKGATSRRTPKGGS